MRTGDLKSARRVLCYNCRFSDTCLEAAWGGGTLAPCSRVLLEKLTVSQLVKKLTAIYGTRKFVTASWQMTNVTHKFLSIYLFITLYLFRAQCSSSGETNCINKPLVTIILYWWPNCVQVESRLQPAHNSATNIERLLPEVVLIQFVSPDDEH
jgi:hypothetical protein